LIKVLPIFFSRHLAHTNRMDQKKYVSFSRVAWHKQTERMDPKNWFTCLYLVTWHRQTDGWIHKHHLLREQSTCILKLGKWQTIFTLPKQSRYSISYA